MIFSALALVVLTIFANIGLDPPSLLLTLHEKKIKIVACFDPYMLGPLPILACMSLQCFENGKNSAIKIYKKKIVKLKIPNSAKKNQKKIVKLKKSALKMENSTFVGFEQHKVPTNTYTYKLYIAK